MCRLLLIMLVVVLTINASAQDGLSEQVYRLRQPTAKDYVQLAPNLPLYDYFDDSHINTSAITREFWKNVGDTATARQILEFFHVFNKGYSTFGNYSPDLDIREWHRDIVTRWLENHPIDLFEVEALWFLRYSIDIMPYDLNGDGNIELLFYIEGHAYSDYWVVQRDETVKSGYNISFLPIAHRDGHHSPSLPYWGGSKLLDIQDLNNDGILDLSFTSWAARPASWTGASEKYLTVSNWTPDEAKNIAYATISTEKYNWLFENTDRDAELEILVVGDSSDNWLCHFQEKITLDWDGETYVKLSDARTFDDSVYCALRMAENAMRDHRYENAIAHYQDVFLDFTTISSDDAERQLAEPFFMYAMERLFVAYVLVEDTENAWKTLSLLSLYDHPDGTLAQAFLNEELTTLSPYSICRLAFETIENLKAPMTGSYDYRDLPMLGATEDEFYGLYDHNKVHGGGNSVGCDFAELVVSQMLSTTFTTVISPEEQIKNLTLTVKNSFSGDLNLDGMPEHVIWLDEYTQPFIFVSSDNHYIVTLQWFPQVYEEQFIIKTIPLPDMSGMAWFISTTDFGIGSGCQLADKSIPSDEIFAKSFSLNYVRGEELVKQGFYVCKHYPDHIEDIVLGDEFTGLVYSSYKQDYVLQMYQWNNEQKAYLEVKQDDLNPSSIEATETAPTINIWDVTRAFYSEDYQHFIDLLAQIENPDIEYIYYRAFAYEQLGTLDEALADYVTLYTEAPDTAWGMLAGLHIEPIGE